MSGSDASPKRGLGRGLSALLGEEADYAGGNADMPTEALKLAKTVPIEYLRPNADQPRKRFDEGAIDGLVESIRQKGVLQPLLVRQHPDDANAYEIVAGERRWRAAQRAQLHEVPVVIKDLSDADALEIAIIENIHREDLTILEEAEGYQKLMDDFGYTQDGLAKSVGKSRSHIANTLRLLGLPEELKSLLDDSLLSPGHARALLGTPNAEALAQEVVKRGLNVRQTEKLVQDHKPGSRKAGKGLDTLKNKIEKADKDPNTTALERSLTDTLGLHVMISLDKPDGEAGSLLIRFDDFDQLDDINQRLSGN